ncbi:MAG TPA: LPS-assembly protein LptD, partial [Candidatus Marinimicrobia bacterium]|nr:LPS-assembly protein LptD [Candidatus Neomarinimicrobiota bacterium]
MPNCLFIILWKTDMRNISGKDLNIYGLNDLIPRLKYFLSSGFLPVCFILVLSLTRQLIGAVEPLILEHADVLNHVKRGDETYIDLRNDVRFKKGAIRITCDNARHYRNVHLLILEGNVTVWDTVSHVQSNKIEFSTDTDKLFSPGRTFIRYKDRTMESDIIRADLQTNRYNGWGNVIIKDSSSVSQSDSVFYDYNPKIIHYYQNAVITDSSGLTILEGDYIRFQTETNDLYSDLNPVFIRKDRREDGQLLVRSDVLAGNTESQIFTGTGNILVERDSLQIFSDSLFFSDKEGMAIFSGSPKMFYKDNRLNGNRMNLSFDKDRLISLTVTGRAKMESDRTGIYKTEERDSLAIFTSTLTGRELWVWFNEENEADYLEMKGMAESDYHILRNRIYQGINHASGDTVRMFFRNDSLQLIHVIRDANGIFYPHPTEAGMDTILVYKANKIHYDMIVDKTDLIHNARLDYGDMNLEADTVRVDWITDLLYAIPQWTDTGAVSIPRLIQRGMDPMYGEELIYNFRTRRGRVRYGSTTLEDGFYTGRQIQKREDDPFYVEYARYTTCDREKDPHYWIESRRMKLIPNDLVVARPLVLRIMNVPVFYLPFGVYPDRKGRRHSGWFMPSFGTSSISGWYLKGAGYYWAPNDYFDTKVQLDFFDLQGIKINNSIRYALRYKLNGQIRTSYNNNFLADSPLLRYDVNLTHQQTLGPSSRLSISGSYTNDRSYYRQTGTELNERLNQKLISNATYTTRIGAFGLSVNASRTEDLITGNVSASAPQISLSKSTAPVFKKKKASDPQRWYHTLTYNYSSSLQNQYSHTLQTDSTYLDDNRNRILHTSSLSLNHKFFNWLTTSPGLSINEGWVMSYKAPLLSDGIVQLDSTGKMILEDKDAFKRRGIYSANLRFSSKFYGIFYLRTGRFEALRHVVSPSMSFSYTPDFSQNPNYVFQGLDSQGKPVKHDYFASTLLGSTPTRDTRTMNWSLGNQFSAKVTKKDDPASYNKFDFLTLNLNGSYNFTADSLRWSPVSVSYRASKLPGNLQFSGNMRFDPYEYDMVRKRRIDNYENFPRLTQFSFDTGFQFSEQGARDTTRTVTDDRISKWQARVSVRYNYTATDPSKTNKNLTLNTSFSANLSLNWSMNYTLNINVIDQKITYQY